MGFPNELGPDELVDLLANRRILFRVEPAALLNDRLVGQIYIKLVNYDRWIDVGHVFMGPSKHVIVLLWEVHKLILEAFRQLQSNLDRSLWVLVVHFNGLQLLYRTSSLFHLLLPWVKLPNAWEIFSPGGEGHAGCIRLPSERWYSPSCVFSQPLSTLCSTVELLLGCPLLRRLGSLLGISSPGGKWRQSLGWH